MKDSEQFKYWLQETYRLTTYEFNPLTLERRCEIIAEFADDLLMEMCLD